MRTKGSPYASVGYKFYLLSGVFLLAFAVALWMLQPSGQRQRTLEEWMPGGPTLAVLALEDIPKAAEVAIVGQVTRMGEPRFNTSSGEPPETTASYNPYQDPNLNVFTPLSVKVEERLGWSGDGNLAANVGDVVEIVVSGGFASVELTASEVGVLGIADGEHTGQLLDGPTNIIWGHAPGIDISLADRGIFFITEEVYRSFDRGVGSDTRRLLFFVGEGQGAFVLSSGFGKTTLPGGDVYAESELRILASTVGDSGLAP